jgi:hypothetical protein
VFSTWAVRSSTYRGVQLAAVGGGVLPGHPKARFTFMTGYVPANVRRLSVRTGDGREVPAALFDHGRGWVWLARETPALRAVEVIGRDASGAIVLRQPTFRRSA